MDFTDISVPVVRGMSHKQIEAAALKFLELMAPDVLHEPKPTPIQEIFENKMDLLGFSVIIGKNVKGLGGVTDVTNRTIELPSASYKRLEKGDPQARFTVAHEFGHAYIHGRGQSFGAFPSRENVMFARRADLKPYEDPEWQANAFGAAVLMPLTTMLMLHEQGKMTPENVMSIYEVSWSAASRRVMRLQKQFNE